MVRNPPLHLRNRLRLVTSFLRHFLRRLYVVFTSRSALIAFAHPSISHVTFARSSKLKRCVHQARGVASIISMVGVNESAPGHMHAVLLTPPASFFTLHFCQSTPQCKHKSRAFLNDCYVKYTDSVCWVNRNILVDLARQII